MAIANKLCLVAAGFALLLLLLGFVISSPMIWQPAAVVTGVAASIGFRAIPSLAGYQFTLWIMTAVVSALIYPSYFLHFGPYDLKLFQIPSIDLQNKWVILIIVQLVMFGMGTKMGIRDFAGVAKMPYPVFIGVGLQFLIMPLMGYTLAKVFSFPPEIAAGVVLIGSCSSGLASNVMCYLAGANLALSITLTAVATLLAPIATTFWMQHLAGEFVEIDSLSMLGQIVKIVLVPIGAALLHDYLKYAPTFIKNTIAAFAVICGLFCVLIGINSFLLTDSFAIPLSPAFLEGLVIFCAAVAFAVTYHVIANRLLWIEENMHLISMFGIIFFTAVTTAAGRDNLLVAGMVLFLAAVIHNLSGYALGYLMSRLAGLDKRSAITVGFEVGMQNGGMASGIAGLMGKLGTVGLAAAVFSPWMNISGSLLANQIRRYNESKAQNSYDID